MPTFQTFKSQLDHIRLTKRTADTLVQAWLGGLPIADIKVALKADNSESACAVIAGAEVAAMFAFAGAQHIQPSELALPYYKVRALLVQVNAPREAQSLVSMPRSN